VRRATVDRVSHVQVCRDLANFAAAERRFMTTPGWLSRAAMTAKMRDAKYRTASFGRRRARPVRPGTRRLPTAYRLLRSLLPAVDPFKHGSVRVGLEFDEFAAPEGAHIGFGRGFSASGDLAEDDHEITVGGETAGRCCEGLLR
jgi:hypothetical protein